MSVSGEGLNDRQRAFAEEYLIDLSAVDAYLRVYGGNRESASRAASRLLNRPEVAAYVQELKDARSRRTEVTADRVVLELARIAYADVRDAMSWGRGGVRWHDSDAIDDHTAAAIMEVSETVREHENDDGEVTRTTTRRMRMHPKLGALQKLAEHVGVGAGAGGVEVNVNVEGMSPQEKDAAYEKLFSEIDAWREEQEVSEGLPKPDAADGTVPQEGPRAVE